MAKLYFRYGAMNSGKSTALLQAAYNYEERGQRVLLAKPEIDTKGASQIESRLGMTREVDFLIGSDDDARALFAVHRQRIRDEVDEELLPAAPADVACLLIDGPLAMAFETECQRRHHLDEVANAFATMLLASHVEAVSNR